MDLNPTPATWTTPVLTRLSTASSSDAGIGIPNMDDVTNYCDNPAS